MRVFGQEDSFIKDLVELISENLSEDIDLTELTERLNYYRQHPLDLNKAKSHQLRELVFLSPLQINNLLDHIAKNGSLLDISELQGIASFDLLSVERLQKFSKVELVNPLKEVDQDMLVKTGLNDLILRYGVLMQTQKGFRDLPGSRYLGSKNKMLLRYRYNFKNVISAGLVMEKDAGENFYNRRRVLDHMTANISLSNVGKIKKLVLGDYSLQFGQGLTLWSGFAFGKGADVTSVASKPLGLKPYSSANEFSFFRGVAGTIAIAEHTTITSFLSSRRLDASLKSTNDSSFALQTLNNSGLHRTKTELTNNNSQGQLVFGAAVQYSIDRLELGLTGYRSVYEHPFITGSSSYNKYSFTGKSLTNAGFNYNITVKNMYSYGEIAHSIGSGWAINNGLLISISQTLSTVVMARHYDKNYHNFFSNGVGENTEVVNVEGIYIGLNYSPNKRFIYSFYLDLFKFPWLKYRVEEPSSGHEEFFQFSYNPSKTMKIIVRLKQERKSQNADAIDPLPGLKGVLKQNVRIGFDWKSSTSTTFQHRMELVGYKKGLANYETGKLIYTDISFKPTKAKVSGNLRLAYFDSPSYNSRIYAYEDDVLYNSTSGLYFNNGIRTYLNFRYNIFSGLAFWTRFAAYYYNDQETIGSGLDEITGNIKSDVKFQFRYQF